MDATHLSVFHSISNCARGKRSSFPRFRALSTKKNFRARDCMIFTLHDLTDFYIERVNVERVTAHRIKINDHSCFHNLWPNSKSKLK